MKTKSCKAKGRFLQKKMVEALLSVGSKKGLVADDIKSTVMGCSGVDVLLSPAAKAVLGDLAVEAKNREALNVTSVFWQHWQKYKKSFPVLVHKKNHTDPLITITLTDFTTLLDRAINHE